MAILKVANVHMDVAGTTRIEHVSGDGNIRLGNGNVLPTENDGGALGNTGLKWSDLFLASGGVINFNSGDTTITHSTGRINVSSNLNASNVQINGSYISPFMGIYKNKIINGNFDYWQRANSNSSVSDGQTIADRWTSYRTGSTANVSRQSFTLGQTDVPNEPTYFHRCVVTTSAGASNYFLIHHPIESVRSLAGKVATLSFYAKADASKNIAVELEQYFGSGGSPSATVRYTASSNFALTTTWQRFTSTFSLSSISGKTIGTTDDSWLAVAFWFDAGSSFNSRTNSLGQQSGTFDIAQVQLEEGPVATAFEQRSLGQELALCQRYYWRTNGFITGGAGGYRYAGGIGNYAAATCNYPVSMRTLPSVSLGLPLTQENCFPESYNTTIDTFHLRVTTNAAGQFRIYPASNFLEFDAEL